MEELENKLSVSFLVKSKDSDKWEWPKTEVVQQIYKHQVFQEDLNPINSGESNQMSFQVNLSSFHSCKELLEKEERHSNVSDDFSMSGLDRKCGIT